jgi:hypothetical protein
MNNYKATPEQWQATKERANNGNSIDIRLLELLSRIEQLEAQANPTKMVPPPVATDEELRAIWNFEGTWNECFRAVYNFGVAHGQASSRGVADPAPVAGGLVELVADLRIMAVHAAAARQFSDGETLNSAANTLQWLSEQEAGR